MLTSDVPEVEEDKRVESRRLGHGVFSVTGHIGFMETPDVPELLEKARRLGVPIDLDNVTYYLGRINLVPTPKRNMTRWQRFLFTFMLRNAVSRSTYLNIPAAKVLEIGVQMEF
jgi:KUP system potassium uptake protein